MAVRQTFHIELPSERLVEDDRDLRDVSSFQLDRAEAEALFADLAEALGAVPAGVADDLAEIISEVRMVHHLLSTSLEGVEYAPQSEGAGHMMSVEEAAAAMQVLNANQTAAVQGRSQGGSGIGNALLPNQE